MNNEREALAMKCSHPCALCLYMTKRIDKALEEMNLPLSLFAGGRTEKVRAAEQELEFCCALSFIVYLVFFCKDAGALILDLRELLQEAYLSECVDPAFL